MNDPITVLREFGWGALLLCAVVVGLWRERTRLRPWHLWTAVAGLLASAAGVFIANAAVRSNGFTGWGALLPALLMFGAAFVGLLCTTVLLTLAVLLPRYGFDRRPAAVRRREYALWRNPPNRRARSARHLAVYATVIVIGALVLKVREALYVKRYGTPPSITANVTGSQPKTTEALVNPRTRP